MAFITYSLIRHGIPDNDSKFSEEDTYITVVSRSDRAVGGLSLQEEGEQAIRSLFNIVYESPVCYNHFHSERQTPSQILLIFEKKESCPQKQSLAHDVLNAEKTPEETI